MTEAPTCYGCDRKMKRLNPEFALPKHRNCELFHCTNPDCANEWGGGHRGVEGVVQCETHHLFWGQLP